MIHICKGDFTQMTRKELHDVQLVQPNIAGDRWMGIQHGTLVSGIIETIKQLFDLYPLPKSEIYAVSPNGTALIGGFSLGTKEGREIKPALMTGIPQETYQAIGFQHSNDCRKALSVSVGGTVSLCTNGMVSASHTFQRKHTTGLDLIPWLSEGLESIWDRFMQTGDAIQSLFSHGIRPQDHDKLLLLMARTNILPWRFIGEVDKLWTTAIDGNVMWSPEWEWGFERNAWDWYNCVTHVAKQIPPIKQLKCLERAFKLTCDLLPKKDRPQLEVEGRVVARHPD